MPDYELHVTHYVLQHFRHLMTDIERAAADAIVLKVVHRDGSRSLSITWKAEYSPSVQEEAHRVLRDGTQAFRRRTRDRIVAAHSTEIYANACPQCRQLPATPRAKRCLWCSHTWREG